METFYNILVYSSPSLFIGLVIFFRFRDLSKNFQNITQAQSASFKSLTENVQQMRNELTYVKQSTKSVIDGRMADVGVMENRFKDAVRNFDSAQKDKMNEILIDLKGYQVRTEELISQFEAVSNRVDSLLTAAAAAGFEGAAQKKN